MAYSEEIRTEIMAKVQNKENIQNLSKEYHISAATIYNWIKASKQKKRV